LAADPEKQRIIQQNQAVLFQLAGIGEICYLAENATAPEEAVSIVVAGIVIYIPLTGLIDTEKERFRLSKELQQLEEETVKLETRIRNPAFAAKAPPAVVVKEEEKLAVFKEKQLKIRERLAELL
jgi:valyl-tRNA synthetase